MIKGAHQVSASLVKASDLGLVGAPGDFTKKMEDGALDPTTDGSLETLFPPCVCL
jgi:hypothetical protein